MNVQFSIFMRTWIKHHVSLNYFIYKIQKIIIIYDVRELFVNNMMYKLFEDAYVFKDNPEKARKRDKLIS